MTTLNLQVGAGADDGWWRSTYFDTTSTTFKAGYHATLFHEHAFLRWTGASIGGTIDAAYIECYAALYDGIAQLKVRGVDEDNPAAPTTSEEFLADPLTTAGVDWDGAWTTDAWNQSPSLVSVFQELVDTYTISNDAVMVQIRNDIGETQAYNNGRTFEYNDTLDAKLHIDYTAEGPAIVEGAAVITGTGALTAAAYAIASGASALSGTGVLSGSAYAIAFGASALEGLGALEGVGVRMVLGASVLSGEGALEGAGVRIVLGVAALSGTGALAADAFLIVGAEAALSGAGALDADGLAIAFGGAALSGVGALTASGEVIPGGIVMGAAVLTGVGDLWGTAYLIVPAATLLSGLGALSATGIVPGERVPRGGMSPRFGAPSGWRAREDERLLEPAEETLGHI